MNGRALPAAGRDRTMHANHHNLHILRGLVSAKPAKVDPDQALDAIDDLMSWAFNLAKKSVDSIDDKERVRNVRRYFAKTLRGRRVRCPTEDLYFTAGVLMRVCESELGYPMATIVRILDDLELPTDVVPRVAKTSATWTGPVTRCPSPPPRSPDEEEAHWWSLWFDRNEAGRNETEAANQDEREMDMEEQPLRKAA